MTGSGTMDRMPNSTKPRTNGTEPAVIKAFICPSTQKTSLGHTYAFAGGSAAGSGANSPFAMNIKTLMDLQRKAIGWGYMQTTDSPALWHDRVTVYLPEFQHTNHLRGGADLYPAGGNVGSIDGSAKWYAYNAHTVKDRQHYTSTSTIGTGSSGGHLVPNNAIFPGNDANGELPMGSNVSMGTGAKKRSDL